MKFVFLNSYCLADRLQLRQLVDSDPDLASMCDLCGKTLPENDPDCPAEC